MYAYFIKRILDFILSLIGCILLSPIFMTVTLVLLFTNKGKPFFLQPRPGKNEKIFKVIKFKSMTDTKDADGELLPFEERVTRFGDFIRTYSLDEIPQLINVLYGQMSIVGPRPLLVQYLPLYSKEQQKRHLVKPGITGWAQVKGRNSISWNKKFELDVWYVEHMSFLLDIKIILLTIKKVLFKEGVNSSENLNMSTFTGGPNE
jgi:undecaprenyl phosphate N,N'-diacetylbacillosamine 1-phosphate transferase